MDVEKTGVSAAALWLSLSGPPLYKNKKTIVSYLKIS